MKYSIVRLLTLFVLMGFYQCTSGKTRTDADTTIYEIWDIDTLENIGGHFTTVIGNPTVVSTDLGRAVEFDGNGDMLLIDANPLGNAKEFTIELIFKPKGSYPLNIDPRFVHIQDLNDPVAKRVMMEIRINSHNQWYLDGFMKTDISNLTLIDSNKVHATGQWMHAAITYKDNVLKTYVNGVEELSGNVNYTSDIVAATAMTSLGARMNQINWYNGQMKRLKVTRKALSPDEFMTITTSSEKLTGVKTNSLFVFPSIADNYVNISISKYFSGLKLNIFNTLGELVYSGLMSSTDYDICRINTDNFSAGMYYLVASSGEFYETSRIIVKH